MITKAIIDDVTDQYHVRVRIPFFDRTDSSAVKTPSSNIPQSITCSVPGMHCNFREGDVVLVGFEDNEPGKPIILGSLFRETGGLSIPDAELNGLVVNANAVLPGQTTIGDVTATEISCLKGAQSNIWWEIEQIKKRLDKLEGN